VAKEHIQTLNQVEKINVCNACMLNKKRMSNLFIVENLKKMTKVVPILKLQIHQNDISLIVKKNQLINVLSFFKNHVQYQFKILTCISGVDYPANKYRFKIVYELLSVRFNMRIRLKVFTHELMPIDSTGKIFPAADWYECEIWDMFGVFFNKHNNLTRLLTDYGFEGYPLRKDFPLTGFIEASYDYTRKRVTNERVELSQEYRAFKFASPWETLELK
jgi:NADH/F420H2 dehydrogenase subunit C